MINSQLHALTSLVFRYTRAHMGIAVHIHAYTMECIPDMGHNTQLRNDCHCQVFSQSNIDCTLTAARPCVHHPAQGLQRVRHCLLVVEDCAAAALCEGCGSLHVCSHRPHQRWQLAGTWLLQHTFGVVCHECIKFAACRYAATGPISDGSSQLLGFCSTCLVASVMNASMYLICGSYTENV